MAGELVETTRLFARCVAAIDPKWLEELGGHLLKRDRQEPHWEKGRGQVVALERGTLYGLPVYASRKVNYGPLDPQASREIFIRAALVEGDFESRAPFFAHNRRLVADIERLEHKSRRPDILVDDELIHAFYDQRVPQGIHDAVAFDTWRKDAERADPKLLYLRREDLMRHEAAGITTDNFPHELQLGPNSFTLEYQFEPGSARDGVTMTVPVALLNQVPAARCEWLVPGLLKEKVRALAKSMPQRLRHKLGAARRVRRRLRGGGAAVGHAARAGPGALHPRRAQPRGAARRVPPRLGAAAPAHELPRDGRARPAARARQGPGRAEEGVLGRRPRRCCSRRASGRGLRGWTMGDLAEIMEIERGGQTLVGYPALVDDGEAVSLQVFDSPEKAKGLHRAGVRRLLAIAFRDRVRDLEARLGEGRGARPAQGRPGRRRRSTARSSATRCRCARRTSRARVEEGRSRFVLIAQEMARTAAGILAEHAALQKKLSASAKNFPRESEDVQAQLERLLAPRLARAHALAAAAALPALPQGGVAAPGQAARRPGARRAPCRRAARRCRRRWQREVAAQARYGAPSAELEQFGWLLEELRVSLFAQELKTPVPVSAKRLGKLWQTMRK